MKSLNFIVVALLTLLISTSCEQEVFVTVPCEEVPVDIQLPNDNTSRPDFPDLTEFNPEYGIPDELLAYGEFYLEYYNADQSLFSPETEVRENQVALFAVAIYDAQVSRGEAVTVSVNLEDVLDCLLEALDADDYEIIRKAIEEGDVSLEDLAGKFVEFIAKKLGGGVAGAITSFLWCMWWK